MRSQHDELLSTERTSMLEGQMDITKKVDVDIYVSESRGSSWRQDLQWKRVVPKRGDKKSIRIDSIRDEHVGDVERELVACRIECTNG